MAGNELATAYLTLVPSLKGAQASITKQLGGVDTTSAGKQMGDKTSAGFGGGFNIKGLAVAAAATAAAAAAVKFVDVMTDSLWAYADREQLVGGVETLFKTSQDVVMGYAENAYKTAGMSANEYMETVTSFSASLIQSLGGDTAKAAEVGNMAITDMSDNANKMGTSMEMIQNAYNGFAKQNYTMLDNLKLGYGGTKEEMARLIKDASEMTEVQKKLGIEVDASSMSFGNIVNAISVMQEQLGIAGTTYEEAEGTISGSLSMVKASWENLLVAISQGGEWDITTYIDNLVSSISTAAGNILPVVEQALVGIAQVVETLVPQIAEKLPGMITDALPGLLTAGVQAADALADGIIQAIPSLLPTVMDIIGQLGKMIIDKAPDIIKCGLTIIVELAKGIAEALPELIPAAVDAILEIVDALTQPDSISMIIEAAIQLILALADGLLTALPRLIERIPDIVENIVTALIVNLPKLIAGLVTLVIEICKHLPEIIAALIQAIPEIISAIIDAFSPLAGDLADSFGSAWDSVKEGFSAAGDWFKEHWGATWDAIKNNPVVKAISDFITNTFNTLKDALGKIWDGIKEAAAGAWDLIKNVLGGAVLVIIDLVTGDFDKLKEDVAHIWENIKDAIDRIFGGIKDAARAALDAVKSIGSDAIATFKNVVSSIKDAIQALPGIIKDKFNQAVDFIKQLPSQALEWGRDLIGKFVEGLKQKWNDLKNSLHNTAQTIRSYLHFSKPDVGPLKDFDRYAPDMVDLFTKGSKYNIGKLESGIGSMTDVIAGSFSADVGYNLPDIAGYASDLSAAITASSAMEIIIPLNVDGREIARASAVYMNEQLAWESR